MKTLLKSYHGRYARQVVIKPYVPHRLKSKDSRCKNKTAYLVREAKRASPNFFYIAGILPNLCFSSVLFIKVLLHCCSVKTLADGRPARARHGARVAAAVLAVAQETLAAEVLL